MARLKLSNVRLKLSKRDAVKFIRFMGTGDQYTPLGDSLKYVNDILNGTIELHIETYEESRYADVFTFDKELIETPFERAEHIDNERNRQLLTVAQDWYNNLPPDHQKHVRVLLKNAYHPPVAAAVPTAVAVEDVERHKCPVCNSPLIFDTGHEWATDTVYCEGTPRHEFDYVRDEGTKWHLKSRT